MYQTGWEFQWHCVSTGLIIFFNSKDLSEVEEYSQIELERFGFLAFGAFGYQETKIFSKIKKINMTNVVEFIKCWSWNWLILRQASSSVTCLFGICIQDLFWVVQINSSELVLLSLESFSQ